MMKKAILIGGLIITLILLTLNLYYNTIRTPVIDVKLKELSENKEDYVGKNIRVRGFVVKSIGAYFGETYVLHSGYGIGNQLRYDGIAIHGENLESFVAYTFDGRNYNFINGKEVVVEGIVRDRGREEDAAQYPLEVKSINYR